MDSQTHSTHTGHLLGLALFSMPLVTGCLTERGIHANNTFDTAPTDATVEFLTGAGGELGVSTDYGIVFLGHGQKSGDVDFSTWFRDGPALETGIIEPLGGQLFVTHAEIELPKAQLSFKQPAAGAGVFVRGREQGLAFQYDATVAANSRVQGFLLENRGQLEKLTDRQMGAGVYVEDEGVLRLVGLVSGRLQLETNEGSASYLTVIGPGQLWRLLAHSRDLESPRVVPKRGDVLR